MKNVDSVVAHFGIKGMKWGHRKNKTASENRPVKKSDLAEITNLLNGLSRQDKQFLALDQKLPLIKKNIRDERHCFVSSVDGKIVGFMRESGRPKGFTLLEELVVAKEHREAGIASKMIDDLHATYPKTLAKTKANNEDMKGLLEKKGYVADNPNSKTVINWIRDSSNTKKSKAAAEDVLEDMLSEEIQHFGGDRMNDVDNVLAHFGIPGMKWGHRKGRMTTRQRQIDRDKKSLETLDKGGHLSVGFGKNRQAQYDKRDRNILEKRVASNEAKLKKPEDTRSADHIKKRDLQKKKLSEMSNDDLKALNTRLQLEKQYKDLTKGDVSAGQKFVTELLTNSAKQTAANYTMKGMSKLTELALKKALGA